MQVEPTSHRLPPGPSGGTGLSYHYLCWQPPGPKDTHQTPAVLLLHGFLDFAWSWHETVNAGLLAGLQGATLYALDLRGHGETDAVGPGGYYHFVDYLADVATFVESLKTQHPGPFHLVGHSMGGSVASYFAGTFPEKVHRLALLEGLGPPEDSSQLPDRVRTWIAAWSKMRGTSPRTYPTVESAAARLRAHDPRLSEQGALFLASRGTKVVRTRDGNEGLAFRHDPLHATPGPYPFQRELAASFWRRIRCPVLLVEGKESEFRHPKEEAAEREGCFANSRKVILENAGHMMQRHQPRALAQALVEFLSQ